MTSTLDTAPTTPAATEGEWVPVCRFDDLQRERAVCAVVAGRQVAVVRTFDDTLHAVSQRDPFSGAFVLSRGLVGSRVSDDRVVPTLQSPLFKQSFDLRTGRCLDDPSVALSVYGVRDRAGVVEITREPLSIGTG